MNQAVDAARVERRLVVVADDFGMHTAVDHGVLALASRDRLSATSVLSLGPSWAESAQALSQTSLQVGLHVDLPAGYDNLTLAGLAAWMRALSRERIACCVDAQFAAFDARWRRPPDYLDGHRHVHQWPGVRDVVLERWQRRYGQAPAWARSTRPPPGRANKASIIHWLGGPAWERRLRQRGIAHNASFLGVYDFRANAQTYLAHCSRWLDQACDGALLMCHPADGHAPDDAIATARPIEYEVWASAELGLLLAQGNLRIAAGGEVPGLWRSAKRELCPD